MARCLQHEVDHLDGKVFLDRLTGDARKRALRALRAPLMSPVRSSRSPWPARVTLEPLRRDHDDDLVTAASDGRLWELWYTWVPSPEAMAADIESGSPSRRRPDAAVRRPPQRHRRGGGHDDLLQRRAPTSRGWRSAPPGRAASAQRTGVNAESKLLLLTHAFEVLGCLAVEFRTHWHNRQSRAAIARSGPSRTACCATTGGCPTARCGTRWSSPSPTPSGRRSATGCAPGWPGRG